MPEYGWTGLEGVSGEIYTFHYWTPGSNFEEAGAVFAITTTSSLGGFTSRRLPCDLLHIDETDNMKKWDNNPKCIELAKKYTDLVVLVYTLSDKAERRRILEDVKTFYMKDID